MFFSYNKLINNVFSHDFQSCITITIPWCIAVYYAHGRRQPKICGTKINICIQIYMYIGTSCHICIQSMTHKLDTPISSGSPWRTKLRNVETNQLTISPSVCLDFDYWTFLFLFLLYTCNNVDEKEDMCYHICIERNLQG